ncbi:MULTISPECIES: response regulator transcription factor [Micrococcaceae]|uniref:DNA-binding NarL/FixJ family response regulator n=1 Tax=Pseudoglutamicibacter albus TaxID=98671 RepID=A0ABU1Z0J4_9MICC|nr:MULTISPECIES: response regulator transcription factor [Micrococcaceae]MCG7304777.1 response regulator transcription factor [Pseudoglutamicibacter albus]MDR7293316.1 DNA-binding NarL/FixJ family response regulator [Pseudoglutamicibacter albus]OFT23407.1 DNA-binding response regulator [Arthrobacter sp. HMSC08H08]
MSEARDRIRIVVVDDHPVVRAGLRALLEMEDDLTVVGEAGSEDDAVAEVERERPDLVLMDLRLDHEGSGAVAIQRLRAAGLTMPVLVLTNHDTDADILAAVEAGASGYLLKDAPPEELLPAVRAAAAGQSALAPAIASRLMERLVSPLPSLTLRELEVLQCVSDGLTNAEIAQKLFVSQATVKTHLVHVFEKLGVTSRTQAVAEARERGLF